MIESIVIEFEKVTKYPLIDFFREYSSFMTNSYGPINEYFSGNTETIANEHIRALKSMTTKTADVMAQFKNFANKFNSCGYWELMDIIETLNTNIEKINKLPKFRHTVLAKRGYTPSVETDGTVGGMRTMDDVADEVSKMNQDNTGWANIMLLNDMNEDDWEIDELSSVKVFLNNRSKVNVTTVVDMPVGEKVYGKDMNCKLQFDSNDFAIVKYKDNLEQKCTILLNLTQGDVPENKLFGKRKHIGCVSTSFMYPELASDIQRSFMQNDLFSQADITGVEHDNSGNLFFVVKIKTKYEYETSKTIRV